MFPFKYLAVLAFAAVALAQNYEYESDPRPAPPRINPSYSGPSSSGPKPTPVPILKQINRHNEDGSYTYGYESADGSFKIETKLPTGEVKGKYGYVDDTGKVRVVEYGATKYGFAPAGEGITVAPPTLVDETTDKNGNLLEEYAGNYADQELQQPAPRPAPIRPRPRPQAQNFDYSGPQSFEPAPQQSPVPQRAQIPGAAPVQHGFDFDFPSARAAPKSYAPRPAPTPAPIDEYEEPAPAPIRQAPRITYAQPAPLPPAPVRSAPPPQYAPAPQYAPRLQPQYAPRPQSTPIRSGGGSILDQLSKDYALPQGGAAPLHDISFGYY